VRPEQVQIAQSKIVNTFPVNVDAVTYMGNHQQLQLKVGDQSWLVHTPPHTTVMPDSQILLHLPPPQIWLMSVG
jgi:ABC-type sugar transport system ATPase subunit